MSPPSWTKPSLGRVLANLILYVQCVEDTQERQSGRIFSHPAYLLHIPAQYFTLLHKTRCRLATTGVVTLILGTNTGGTL